MNEKHDIIMIDGNDKTDSISSCKESGGKYNIRFKNNTTTYTYGSSRVSMLSLRKEIDPNLYRVYARGKPLVNAISILDYGECVKVSFDGNQYFSYKIQAISFERNCLADDAPYHVLSYFKELSSAISLKTDDGNAILAKQYNSIGFVGQNGVLGQYLAEQRNITSFELPSLIIFPFGLNPSQKEATAKALSSQISIIEGPPGTGKTQTILNIIANIVLQGKTVAVVSGNNPATANVMEKLGNNGVSYICAFLGRDKNKDEFLEGQTGAYPDMSEWSMATGQMLSLGDSISKLTSQLDEMLRAKNRIAEIRQILSDLAQEKKYFDHYNAEAANSTEPRRSLLRLDAERALRLWLECERYFDKARVPAWWFRFKCAILYGIKNMDFKQNSPAQLIPVLQDLYYRLLRKEFESELVSLEKRLEGYRFKEKMRELANQSMTLFRAKLSERYGNEGIRRIFKKDDLWREADSFIKEYPVVLSTTYSIQSSLSKGFMFDYVIVDEASQVDLATGALAFACAKNVVIVGDLKQLPNVVTDENKKQAAKIKNQYSIRDYYDYTMHSLLSSAVAIWPNAPRTLLREHYRCHPKIIGFCNQKFYDNQLIVMTEDHGEENVLGLYYTNPGNHARGRINQRQIDVIVGEIVPELNAPLERIGVVSPYRDQANYAAKTSNGSGMESDTVHKYQGREKENIIITTVDNQIGEFADNPNLLNVAVSRAIKRLRLVVSPDEYNENTNTGDLIRYIKYHNFIVVHSDIRSIFDLLYKSYSTKRLELLRHHRKVSQYDSENLMYDLILRVLADEPFQKLDVVLHHPLNTLLQNLEKLEENERIYALHPATHVDFVIYNKMDKAPMLAVEVDGVAFHAQNRNQERRDKLKDEILAKHGIPLLRLRTDGSGEDRKLRENLIRASVSR